jgi:molecular chaperone GrpE
LSSHRDREKKEDAASGIAAVGNPPADSESPASAGSQAGDFALADQVQKLLAEKQDLMNTLVRRQADFENYRKRVEKERHTERHRAVEALVEQILPVFDAFERALSAHDNAEYAEYKKGFELIHRQLWDALSKQGLKRIEAVGKEFDPHFHHAIENVPTTDQPEGFVVDQLQPGYVFHDRVLRPAMVRVAVAPAN